jgi:hypothetical protein
LVVELAIRTGELETAAEILSLGLRMYRFNHVNGGDLGGYLLLPGVYDVLPLLARHVKEGNQFLIDENDAMEIVKETTAALELRAREEDSGLWHQIRWVGKNC